MEWINTVLLLTELVFVILMIRNSNRMRKSNKEFANMLNKRKEENDKFWKEIEEKIN
tara:strand:+ start:3281 stop:3451 length:171 start_codon:yes stop_codon:yes gene_type:complete